MFELLLIFVIIPLRMFPVARESGRSGLKWALIGSGAFFVTELVFGLLCYGVYFVSAYLFGWEEEFDESALVFTGFIYLFAMMAGFVCAEVIRFQLKNPRVSYFDLPPPPPRY